MKKPRRDESHDMALDLDGHPIPMAPGDIQMTDKQRWYHQMAEFYGLAAVGAVSNGLAGPAKWVARLAGHFGRLALLQTYVGDIPENAPPEFVEDCLHWRGRVLEGAYRHWCMEWDDLPIDETCPEWPCDCAEMAARFAAERSSGASRP